jgi:integrase
VLEPSHNNHRRDRGCRALDTLPTSLSRWSKCARISVKAWVLVPRRSVASLAGRRPQARHCDVKMLPSYSEIGRALDVAEETSLLGACRQSRSRSLLPIVTLALSTGMRRGEILSLTWQRVDFLDRRLTVGTSKTESGRGRHIPLNERAQTALEAWATNFPNRRPEHYVFAAEKYGIAGDNENPHVYSMDASKPLNSFKEAWESAKDQADVRCRFHDLRHSACTRMVERGVPLPVIASLLGWSAGTNVRMGKRYGHISAEAQRKAVEELQVVPPQPTPAAASGPQITSPPQ